MVWTLSDLD